MHVDTLPAAVSAATFFVTFLWTLTVTRRQRNLLTNCSEAGVRSRSKNKPTAEAEVPTEDARVKEEKKLEEEKSQEPKAEKKPRPKEEQEAEAGDEPKTERKRKKKGEEEPKFHKKLLAEICKMRDEFGDLRNEVIFMRETLDRMPRSLPGAPASAFPRSCPPPPPPPPLPLPSAEFLRQKRLENRMLRKPSKSDEILNTSVRKIDMSDVLKDLGKVRLRKIERSPGGTPRKPPAQTPPSVHVGEMLRKQFKTLKKVDPPQRPPLSLTSTKFAAGDSA
ncbi:hypothetical protein L596_022997 [Steinernema carpocapsae]|uniref:Uncharacterized protein n=1 Tax=Steinernema carpocapsae TaxID=34508 RepID=A0A4U5MC98_STECR|nr:hypothetical protein L596_022997 [Steinernema carpocapsae]